MNNNVLIGADSYKMSHMVQYPEGTTKVYSYLCARSDKEIPYTVFYGLQYYLKEFLTQTITDSMVDEFLELYKDINGAEDVRVTIKMKALAKLGYLPLEIKAVPEGTIMPVKNVLMTMTNTLPEFYWVVGFVETLLLKVWNTSTVAAYSLKLRKLADRFTNDTCDNNLHSDWQFHDFGLRGVSSQETGALSGSAHLLVSRGTDTVPAVQLLKDYYNASGLIGMSVPASEHSVMCSFGQEHELDAFKNMLKLYPTGIVSIVSDTYNFWNVMTNFTSQLKQDILARDGKVVFRPDSGTPELIICGNPNAREGSPENLGAIRLLDQMFGSTINNKGYKVLNPKVGLIYGDGMYYGRVEKIFQTLKDMGYASSNIVFGIGGLLLQQHSRDEQGFAIKATSCEINGEYREIVKDPITDVSKKSHKGLIKLIKNSDGQFVTLDQVSEIEEKEGLLELVFKDGKLIKEQTLDQIRERVKLG